MHTLWKTTIEGGSVRLLAASLALALGSSPVLADGVQLSRGWTATRTEAFQSGNATFQGYSADSEKVSIAITLKLRNKETLDAYTRELFEPNSLVYHRFLTQAQSAATFAPTAEQANAVADYLRKQGFTNVEIAPNRLLVTADGSVGQARSAFRTTIARFTVNGKSAIANDTPVQVPAELGQVDQVVGLDTVQHMHTYSLPNDHLQPAYALQTSGAHGYYPEEFATVYNAGNTVTGRQTMAAVIGWGNMTNPAKDLAQFTAGRGLAAIPSTIVSTGQGTSNDDLGQGEWAMDAQAIAGISGGVKQLIFYTSGGNITTDWTGQQQSSGASSAAILKALNRAVSDNTAKVLDMSWGASECGATSKGFANSVFQLGVAQGQTFAASSGDNGAYPCNAPANGAYGDTSNPAVGYPASSPYVVAVGGTTLNTTTADAYISEAGWPYSGGGVSLVETTPPWQPASFAHRQVPDLAFDADWEKSPILYYLTASAGSGVTQSGYYANGGTSLSAPLFVGAWARLESANGNRIGFAAPAIYAYAASTTSPLPLQDIATGSNGAYAATKGLDRVTGWGSFNIQSVASFIARTPGFIDASNKAR